MRQNSLNDYVKREKSPIRSPYREILRCMTICRSEGISTYLLDQDGILITCDDHFPLFGQRDCIATFYPHN